MISTVSSSASGRCARINATTRSWPPGAAGLAGSLRKNIGQASLSHPARQGEAAAQITAARVAGQSAHVAQRIELARGRVVLCGHVAVACLLGLVVPRRERARPCAG